MRREGPPPPFCAGLEAARSVLSLFVFVTRGFFRGGIAEAAEGLRRFAFNVQAQARNSVVVAFCHSVTPRVSDAGACPRSVTRKLN